MRLIGSAAPDFSEAGDVDARDDADDVIVVVRHRHVAKAQSAEEGEQPGESRSYEKAGFKRNTKYTKKRKRKENLKACDTVIRYRYRLTRKFKSDRSRAEKKIGEERRIKRGGEEARRRGK